MLATQAQLFRLVAALLPNSPEGTTAPATSPRKATPWSKVYSDLYGLATGWLGWTPDQTWDATPQEITDAFLAYTDKLKALRGGDESEDNSGNSEEQRQANIEAGYDPEFDRVGFAALRGLGSIS